MKLVAIILFIAMYVGLIALPKRKTIIALAVAAVATVAAAALARPDGDEERVPAALALLHRAVLVVCKLILRARVPEPPGPPEAEDAALAVVAGEEWGAWNAEQ